MIFNKKGVTLIETVVVVVIVAILAVMWGFLGTSHRRNAALVDGRAFIDDIVTRERLYRAEKGVYKEIAKTAYSPDLQLTAKHNRYFNEFEVTNLNDTEGKFTVAVFASGKNVADGISITANYNAQTNDFDENEDGTKYKENGL